MNIQEQRAQHARTTASRQLMVVAAAADTNRTETPASERALIDIERCCGVRLGVAIGRLTLTMLLHNISEQLRMPLQSTAACAIAAAMQTVYDSDSAEFAQLEKPAKMHIYCDNINIVGRIYVVSRMPVHNYHSYIHCWCFGGVDATYSGHVACVWCDAHLPSFVSRSSS